MRAGRKAATPFPSRRSAGSPGGPPTSARGDGVDGSARCGDSGRRSGSRGFRKGPAGAAVTAGRTSGVQEPAIVGQAARHARQVRKRRRAKLARGSGQVWDRGAGKGRTSRVRVSEGRAWPPGPSSVGRGRNRADQGSTGRAKQAHRGKARVSAAMRRPAVPRKRGCRWCRISGVHARSGGPREASGSPLSRPDNGRSQDRPWRLFIFGDFLSREGRGGADGPLAGTAGTPSARRSLMSRPDNTARRLRRLRFPDGICVTRPLPPANRILGLLQLQAISITCQFWPGVATPRRGPSRFSALIASAIELIG